MGSGLSILVITDDGDIRSPWIEGLPVPRAPEPSHRSDRLGTALDGRVSRVPWFYLGRIPLRREVPPKGAVTTHTPGYFWTRWSLGL